MKIENKCKYWGENIYPWFDDGCHIGYSFCDPDKCKSYTEYHEGRRTIKTKSL